MKRFQTTCSYCGTGYSMNLSVENKKIVKTEPIRMQMMTKAVAPSFGINPDLDVICNSANKMELERFDFYKAGELLKEVQMLNAELYRTVRR